MATSYQTGILAGVLLVMFSTASAAAPTRAPEQIGSWILDCPIDRSGSQTCQLRSGKRLLDQGGIVGDLEIQLLGESLVPVIILRGLPGDVLMTASLAATTQASIQFAGATPENLKCAVTVAGYLCAPTDHAARRLAARLPSARFVTVRVSVSVPGLNPLPAQEKSLGLSGTSDALARLREAGPTPVPRPSTAFNPQSPAGLIATADKALKAAGYQNGVANLQNMLTQYMKK